MNQQTLDQGLAGLCPAVKFLDETDSTNRLAAEWARAGAPGNAIVVADYQSAGRGRFDRTWFGPPGECLLFSIILRPDCKPEEAPLINLAAAVALSTSIETEGLKAKVKWPNDVLIAGRKTAGILAEAVSFPTAAASGSMCVVLGVGINVNVGAFPPELAMSATSLALQAGRPIDRLELLKRFVKHLWRLLEAFPAGVIDAYVPRSDVLGRNVKIRLPKGTVEGKAERIDVLGNLVLDTGETISVGDVGYLQG